MLYQIRRLRRKHKSMLPCCQNRTHRNPTLFCSLSGLRLSRYVLSRISLLLLLQEPPGNTRCFLPARSRLSVPHSVKDHSQTLPLKSITWYWLTPFEYFATGVGPLDFSLRLELHLFSSNLLPQG